MPAVLQILFPRHLDKMLIFYTHFQRKASKINTCFQTFRPKWLNLNLFSDQNSSLNHTPCSCLAQCQGYRAQYQHANLIKYTPFPPSLSPLSPHLPLWATLQYVTTLGLTSSSFHKFGTANDSKRSAPQSNFTFTGSVKKDRPLSCH